MDQFDHLRERRPNPAILSHTRKRVEDVAAVVVCLECGRSFDKRNLAHALFHAEPGHDPFVVEA